MSGHTILALGLICSVWVPFAHGQANDDVRARHPNPGVVLRFDDTHSVDRWQALLDVFNEEGVKASFAIPCGHLKSDEQVEFLRRAAAAGHELMDHTHGHLTYSYRCRDAKEFEEVSRLPFVAETYADTRQVGFKFSFDGTKPGSFPFRGFVTNGILVVSKETAKRLHRPDKIYIPSFDRYFGFFDDPGGHIALYSFYSGSRREHVDVSACEMRLCSHAAFSQGDEVIRFQAERSRAAFRRLGLPEPKSWIQPGGWDADVPADQFRRVYVREYGYTAADCVPGYSREWNGRPDAPDPVTARYTFRPTGYFDMSGNVQAVRDSVLRAQAEGRAICLISHMQVSSNMKGGWNEWLAATRELIRWLKAKRIPIRTFSETADVLWGSAARMKPSRY